MYRNLKRGEDTEQMGVIDWANWNTGRFPELKLLFHIPNGGKRDVKEAARFCGLHGSEDCTACILKNIDFYNYD